jgi:hypothetical protein
MPSLSPNPGFEYYYKACRKGDREGKAVAVGYSPMRVLADASEITGLPRDNFEVHEISRESLRGFQTRSLIYGDFLPLRDSRKRSRNRLPSSVRIYVSGAS